MLTAPPPPFAPPPCLAQAAAFLHASLPMDALVGGMAPGEEHPSPVDVLTLAAGVLEHHRGDWAAAADTMIRMIAHDLNRLGG